jgi:DNA-binding MarR family transcriptional regulator
VSENNRRARYYTLTASGRRQLEKERAAFDRRIQLVQRILEPRRTRRCDGLDEWCSGFAAGAWPTSCARKWKTHRALREEALAREGVADAAAQSRRAFGNCALAQEDARDVWIWPWLDGLVRDADTRCACCGAAGLRVHMHRDDRDRCGRSHVGAFGRPRGTAEPAALSESRAHRPDRPGGQRPRLR